ncbi:Uncharacterised protein [Bordetella ansorpii]|uniref:Uncharacterized protein n=1 Tax=Bordetella ansorpii TaxID=288768 RepID=A0A157RDJ7_9BORD|nr:Uncharacterised protein [Bordetella ansorpii]
MTSDVQVLVRRGPDIAEWFDAVAGLRASVFRSFPYLYTEFVAKFGRIYYGGALYNAVVYPSREVFDATQSGRKEASTDAHPAHQRSGSDS